MHKSYKHLKRLIRDLTHWAKRHPWKVIMMVLMPLISGGVLTALLARFGLRLPASLEKLVGIAGKAVTGDTGGLVGEAVRFAGNGFGEGSATVKVRDGDRGMRWEKSYKRTDDAWGDTMGGFAKMFI